MATVAALALWTAAPPERCICWGVSSGGGVIAARLARESGKEHFGEMAAWLGEEQRRLNCCGVGRGGAAEAELSGTALE
jgi:fermentation-respiration switch protein FrsA (DUF1100 family)